MAVTATLWARLKAEGKNPILVFHVDDGRCSGHLCCISNKLEAGEEWDPNPGTVVQEAGIPRCVPTAVPTAHPPHLQRR